MPYISEDHYQKIMLENAKLEDYVKKLMECLEEIMGVEGGEPDFSNETSVKAWAKAEGTILRVRMRR